MRRMAALLLAALPHCGPVAAAQADYVLVPAGEFKSALRYEDTSGPVRIHEFRLMRTPVSNGQFLAFVRAHPEWQRGHAPPALAERRYLTLWAAALEPGVAARPNQPVTWVSWFAAHSYCEAQGARLPTWLEWEYVASADATRRDARADPAWRETILEWYSRPSNDTLPEVGLGPANVYGIQDLHGLVWEWIEDASALLVASDNREQGAADKLRFCGAGALSTDDRENYAILMRVAMLSSLAAADATGNLGFRCAQDAP
jgi:formylglycine-generating enzyme required for sulfatase activity